jgi:hypothetical protein
MTLRNRLNHFKARSKRSASKPNAKKTSKLTPNDNSRHVQLINLEPFFLCQKCLLNWDAYLSGMLLYDYLKVSLISGPHCYCLRQPTLMEINPYTLLEPKWGLSYKRCFGIVQCDYRFQCDFLVDSDSLLSSKVVFMTPRHKRNWKEYDEDYIMG